MSISILVRAGFGRVKIDSATLSDSERDRLTSKTKTPEENLSVEFGIEKKVRKYGEKIGCLFCEPGETIPEGSPTYSMLEKNLFFSEEEKFIKELSLPIPNTCKLSFLTSQATFPFIIKNPESRKGREVYLLTNKDMLDRLMGFVTSTSAFVPSLGGNVSFNPAFERETFIAQDYIETPGDHFTSYRILVSCTGKVFGSRLVYSGSKKGSGERLTTSGTQHWHKRDLLSIHDSPFYLGSVKVVSNQSAGGSGITLDRSGSSVLPNDSEKEILESHGLNPDSPSLPHSIREHSQAIGRYLGLHGKGMIYGIDWLQSKSGEFYYLETNLSPGSKAFIDTAMNGIGTHEEAMVLMMTDILEELAKKHR